MAVILDEGRYKNQIVFEGVRYLGEQSIAMNGSSQACTLPADTNMVEIAAEGGDVRYTVNAAASADSGGYIPSGQKGYVFKLSNLTSLALFGASPAKAHMLYYKEA